MDLRLSGKRVLITGASQGIGLGVAEGFAAEGCHLILNARNAALMEAAAVDLRKLGAASVTVHASDLAAPGAAAALSAAAGVVDVLVNNAGAVPQGSIDQIDEARWRTAWDLKIFGYINLSREVYAGMAARTPMRCAASEAIAAARSESSCTSPA